MDFNSRSSQPQHPMPMGQSMEPAPSSSKHKGKSNWSDNMIVRAVNVLMSGAVVVVLIGLLIFIAYDKNTNPSADTEARYVQTSKLQAVFLNTGQVYFGNITAVNVNYLTLTHIFYLQSSSSSTTTSTSTPSNVTLVKLGCELHAPLDQMVINRSSVTFWENLSPSGQVAQAVAKWQKENPDGQKCSTSSSTTGTSTSPQTTK